MDGINGYRKWVLDTNVLISAALSARSAPAQLLHAILSDHLLVFSQPTYEELRSRLYRPKFDRYISVEDRQSLLHDFNAVAHWVQVGAVQTYCRDADDDVFIETALQAQAYAIVSGDNDVLQARAQPGLLILTVQQALKHL